MNILLTCAGRRNYIVDYFKIALSPFGGKVFAANNHAHAAAFISADQSFIVPSLYDPDYIDVLIKICHEYDVRAIIPLFDLELPVLAKARKRLAAEGITAVVSSPEVVNICNDKLLTVDFLSNNGFKAPRTYMNIETALKALSSNEIEFPLIIKPRWGMGSIGLLEAQDENELRVLYNKSRRIIESSYLANESYQDQKKSILIQEKLRGKEYGLDVINDLDGVHVITFVKKKISMRAGETDSAVTVNEPQLRDLGAQLAVDLGHVANLDVDVFVNENGIYILEMNPRFGGGYPFSHLAGANLPSAIVAWLRGEKAQPSCFHIKYDIKGVKGILPLKIDISPRNMTKN